MLNFILSPVRLLYNFICLISSILSYFVHPFYAWINFSCRFFVLAWIYAMAKCFPPFLSIALKWSLCQAFCHRIISSNSIEIVGLIIRVVRSFRKLIEHSMKICMAFMYWSTTTTTLTHTLLSTPTWECSFFSLHRNSFKIYYETLAKMQRDKNKAASDCDCNCISLSVVFAWIR